ncbi:MAG: GMC family oxidoreductase [Chromatiales bacterium]
MIIETPRQHYPVVIVGGGPAGISVATRLAELGQHDILLLESGRVEYDQKQNALGKIEAEGDLTSEYFQQHNLRLFGGATAVWGGFCATLEQRAFQTGQWPIAYDELARFYPHAARILELPDSAWQRPVIPIDGTDELVYRPFYLSPPVRFGKKFLPIIRNNKQISLLPGHTLTKIRHSNGRAESLLVNDADGRSREIRADQIVIAAGGIQNARLLQLSGLESPATGRYLMEHPHLYAYGKIMLAKPVIDASRKSSGRRVDALQLSDVLCENLGLLSFSVGLNDGRDEHGLPDSDGGMLQLGVTIRAEMSPLASNRVSLAQRHDHFDQPETKINFHFDYDAILKKSWQQFGESLLRNGLGRISSYHTDYDITGGGHMIGTTRMGLSSADSVVDSDCRLHQLDNLYLAGSSVFPAGAAANPTFSIVALALRLAEHLSGRLTA